MYIRRMNFVVAVTLSFSILLPGIVALLRYEMIDKAYYPFIYFIWLSGLNEVLNFILVMNSIPNFINNNIYVLISSIFILTFLEDLYKFRKLKKIHLVLICALGVIWLFENFIFWKINEVGVLFRICYSFLIVLFAVNSINYTITTSQRSILRNADFLVCVGLIIYFTFRVLVESFWLYGLNSSVTFQTFIYFIMIYAYLFCNLLYTLAILWMPKRQVFTMPS